MNDDRSKKLSAVRRLPSYLNKLYELKGRGGSTVTLTELALRLNWDDSVIMDDLVLFGAASRMDVGFKIDYVISVLEAY